MILDTRLWLNPNAGKVLADFSHMYHDVFMVIKSHISLDDKRTGAMGLLRSYSDFFTDQNEI